MTSHVTGLLDREREQTAAPVAPAAAADGAADDRGAASGLGGGATAGARGDACEHVESHGSSDPHHDGCGCGHDGCDHDHDGCDHDHDGCGHDHDGCDHDHDGCDHDHDGCGCEHDGCDCDHDHEACACDHDHDHDACACGCGCEHDQSAAEHELAAEPSFSYRVIGLDCPNCALKAQNAVRSLPSVADARLVYATATLEVVMREGESPVACRRQVLETIRSCGQDLELSDEEREELQAGRSWLAEHRATLLMTVSGIALAAGLALEHLFGLEDQAIIAYVIAAVAGLVFVAPMAWASLRRGTADMNVLMGIAVLGGLAMGFSGDRSTFADAAIVIFLNQVGEWLEGWSMRKTSGSIKELMRLAPELAHVVGPDAIEDVAVGEVREGQRIRVLPGERVPLDGTILSGASSLNEAAITGESVPKDKGVGDEVFAGSLNTSGVIELEVTADEDCTMLSRIVSMVQGAQAQKAPYESFVDRFAAVYTPIVVGCAAVVGIGVPLVLSLVSGFDAELWHDWVYRALSLLVVACPCALVISTPVSFVSAITRAARNGVLVKGGAYFDIASRVSAIAFDKTGTLTTGSPQVVGVVACTGHTEDEVLAVGAALEASSTHPLGRAVLARRDEAGLERLSAEGVQEIAAQGVRGMVSAVPCAIGKPAFAAEQAGLSDEVSSAVAALGERGATALVVTCGGEALGVIGVADTLRPEVPATMRALSKAGAVRSLEMLTGDSRAAAEAIARQAAMTHAVSELLPDGKVAYVRDLQAAGEVVAMVGDGINDAPALAAADLGIAMGAASSDTALEVADVALLGDDLAQLPRLIELSVRTMHIVGENIAIAIIVKALAFVAVIAGVAGMGAAVFADTGVALLVILNGLRLMIDSRLRW